MFTLALSWVASFLGPIGLVFGILGGLLLDQAFLVWLWQRKLEAFYARGKPIGWGQLLEARLLYLVWMHSFLDLGNPFADTKAKDNWNHLVKTSLGTLGKFPPIFKTSLEVMENNASVFDAHVTGSWSASHNIGKNGRTWLFSLVRDTLCAEEGFEANYQVLWNLGLASGMEPREFKTLLADAPAIPKTYAFENGLGRTLPVDIDDLRKLLGGGKINAQVYAYLENLLEIRNNLIDSYAEESMK